MSTTKATSKKPASAAARVDPKKVATLRETFPFLSEDAATLHLNEANGNITAATDLVLNGERWQKTSAAKPRKVKDEKAEEQPVRRPERKRDDREPRKPLPKRADRTAAPATTETTAAQVQQKDVTSSSWVKGQGLSFLDMLKKKTEAEAPPPPPPVIETPALPVQEAPPAPAPEAAAEEKPAKQRREKKPRAEAPAAPAVEAVEVAPVVVALVVQKPVVKHVLRFDRVDELLLPPHMADLALRSGNQFTFSGTPGVEQSPPPQPQPVNSFQQQSTFAMQRLGQQTWGTPEHNVAPSQRNWNDNNNAPWPTSNNIPQQQRAFTAYQPPQRSFNQFPSVYPPQQQQRYQGNSNNHHNHHRGHELQASNDAYNAIRENNAIREPVYNHHTGATW